ncbi:hypothetical protein [Pseudaestuariivita atlantica]|uniref:Uncharacterized protein n=1 Tax=Pseudaestuariivita atlantica TaxID=1317121 RepID=A0A0L1JLW9_9RHOB|nr:hypothetical protein [Pseudaestuariivita atlantica]KNG92398.1 hypothetical protein ATO11_17465 [Pseudaestuariivita atlantica]
MLLTLILAALAGAFHGTLRPHVADLLARVMDESEAAPLLDVASFACALLAVAILVSLSGLGGNAVVILAGGLAGAFHRPIKAWIMERMG